MKLCKATIYYFDLESNTPTESLRATIDSRDWCDTAIFDDDIIETDMGEWYEEISINQVDATKEDYEEFFKYDKKFIMKMAKGVCEIMKTSCYTGISLDKAKEYVIKSSRELMPFEIELFEQQLSIIWDKGE